MCILVCVHPLSIWSSDILSGSVRVWVCVCRRAWVWTRLCTCIGLINVCEQEREAGQTQWIHYLSADKCHQAQLLGGLRVIWVGQTGVLVLLEGAWGGVYGVWQSNGWGRWRLGPAGCNQQAPAGNPSLTPSTHTFTCRFLLTPAPQTPSYSPSNDSRGWGGESREQQPLVKGHWYQPKMWHGITVACLLGLDLHCQMSWGRPIQSLYTSIFSLAALQAPPQVTDGCNLFHLLL